MKANIKIYLFLFLFGTIILFFISPDSYLDDIFGKYDEATFFMSGKAWMNGMTPYVDFSDSKGPLLWLIYGLGYLLSHYNYIGIFWIECFWYSFVFIYIYKLAGLFLKDQLRSGLVTVLMALVFFNPWFRHEIRAEDFCHLFIVASLYYTIKLLYSREVKRRDALSTYLCLGVSIGATLMIKFTIAAMIGILALYVIYHLHKARKYMVQSCLMFLLGFVALTLPFLVYFYHYGCLTAFIDEYFFASASTLHSLRTTFNAYAMSWIQMFVDPKRILLFGFSFLGCYLIGQKMDRYKWFPVICLFWFLIIANFHNMLYYYEACFAFSVFIMISVISKVNTKNVTLKHLYVVAFLTLLYVSAANLLYGDKFNESRQSLFRPELRRDFYNMEYIIHQVQNPKIITFPYTDQGNGILSNALPACKYWFLQDGASDEMRNENMNAIKERRPDFIVITDVKRTEKLLKLDLEDILNYGYTVGYQYTSDGIKGNGVLLSKNKTKMPPNHFYVPLSTILLKQNILKD